MKVVINVCFGGYSLSPKGVAAFYARKGRPCYFFRQAESLKGQYIPCTIDEAAEQFIVHAFDVPNPNEVLPKDDFGSLSMPERQAYNAKYEQHSLEVCPEPRHDPDLVAVVEELGGGHRTGASGKYAQLSVVEIPDGTQYTIEEYDGNEHIAEVHQTWR